MLCKTSQIADVRFKKYTGNALVPLYDNLGEVMIHGMMMEPGDVDWLAAFYLDNGGDNLGMGSVAPVAGGPIHQLWFPCPYPTRMIERTRGTGAENLRQLWCFALGTAPEYTVMYSEPNV